ncbi:MAG: hypothetical protein CMH57_02255 [Myxococcales bacterium]|nr:hypothetical protein [Myxococcales bacterium]
MALGACSERSSVTPPTPTPAAPVRETIPDTAWLSAESCQPCHAVGAPTAKPWDAVSVYPDLYGHPPLNPTSPEWVAAGLADRLPTDMTVSEWQIYKKFKKDKEPQGCLGCHEASAAQPEVSLTPGPLAGVDFDPRVPELHRWLHTPDDALERTFGVWLNASTHRTLLILTVKVLNYGAGHRAPTSPGSHVLLLVDAVDSEGAPLALHKGYRLPEEVGARFSGRAGELYGRFYGRGDAQTLQERPDGATRVVMDSRLQAGQHDELNFVFLLPEEAPEEGVAWSATARLVWRGSLAEAGAGRVLEEARADSSGKDE